MRIPIALSNRLSRIPLAWRHLKFLLSGKRFPHISFPDRILREALRENRLRSDISDHLPELYFCTIDSPSELIVELGTRAGESTRALLAAAATTNRQVLSIDLSPCGEVDAPHPERWHFIQADDVAFGHDSFETWCHENGCEAKIGTLFIDTSHEYQHTREEIDAWFPFLAPGATVMFHDTNMGNGVYARIDGSIGHGWDNRRGVIRAIEEYLGRNYDEFSRFTDCTDDFLIRHSPYCNGFTVMKRIHFQTEAAE